MLCGMSPAEKKDFILDDPKTYKFLANGNLPVPGVNDSQEFEDTKEAMNIMGMSEEEQTCKSSHVVSHFPLSFATDRTSYPWIYNG